MTIEELKNRYGFNSKTRKVRCFKCGKELEMPNMLSEKLRKEVLRPYCPAGTVFTIGWLITHGWHCTRHEAEPSGAFLCPDCYEEGDSGIYQDQICGRLVQASRGLDEWN